MKNELSENYLFSMFTSVILCESSLMPFSHLHLHLFNPQHITVNVLFSMHILMISSWTTTCNISSPLHVIGYGHLLVFPFLVCYKGIVPVCNMLLVHACYACTYYMRAMHVECSNPCGLYCNQSNLMIDSVVKLFPMVKGLSLRSFNSDLARALFQV